MLVTISNLYGCGAMAVAKIVAAELQYELVDRQLPEVVARRLKTSAQAVESAEDAGVSISERLLRVLELGTPEMRGTDAATFDEECLREIRETVREYAARGDAVFFGRGAHAILGRRPDTVRAFLQAPREWRIRRIVEASAVDEKTAAAELDRVDRARRDYMRAYYEIEWTDPQNYDIVLDVAAFGQRKTAELVVAAVRAR